MLILVANAPQEVAVIGVLIFVLGMFTNSVATGFPILSAAFYPTAIRATGTSWATGIARFGAIGGALTGTALVAAGLSYQQVFLALLVPAAVSVLAVTVKAKRAAVPRTRRRTADLTTVTPRETESAT
jgi:AAHS family 4-hydroxybenzoate transporter-like MFS transporter